MTAPNDAEPTSTLPAAIHLVGRRVRPIGLGNAHACESIGSWLLRSARHNGFESLAALMQKTRYYNVHLDIPLRPQKYVPTLSLTTGRPTEEIGEMLLGKSGFDEESQGDFTARTWVLSARDQRPQALDGMRHVVCPQCIQEDAEPYWRKYWRFSFATVCRVHGALLQEFCARCHSLFVIDGRSIASPGVCGTCLHPLGAVQKIEPRFRPGPVESMLVRVFVEGRPARLLGGVALPHQRVNFGRLVELLCSPAGLTFQKSPEKAIWPENYQSFFRGGLITHFPRMRVRERRSAMDYLESMARHNPVALWQLVNFRSNNSSWLSLAKLLLHAPAAMRWGRSSKQELGESRGSHHAIANA